VLQIAFSCLVGYVDLGNGQSAAAGIPLREIRHVSDGDLILKMLQALNMAANLAEDVGIAPEIETTVEDCRARNDA
jgi:hypothetical protein